MPGRVTFQPAPGAPMIVRRTSLSQALDEIESGALAARTVVVSRRFWDALSQAEQDGYRGRAARAGVELRADEVLSSHFVEVRQSEEEPPLSTEHPM